MTPPDKSGSTGQPQKQESEQASSVATDGQAKPAEQATGGPPEANGAPDQPATDQPTARITADDRAAVAADGAAERPAEPESGTPPPWARVPDDSGRPASQQQPQPGQPAAPAGRSTPVGESTVAIERPVVTGAAAARLFAEGAVPSASTVPKAGTTAAAPSQSGQNRTTVHLDGGNPSTGPLRIGATATPSALRRPGRGPRRANLQIKRFDPWSVLKLSLVLSVALFFVWLVAVGVLYAVLDGMGVWDKLNGISSEILQPTDDGGSAQPLISAGRVFGVAAIIGAVNIVLFSALATVGAFIYNVSADLAGGLEVTLAERE